MKGVLIANIMKRIFIISLILLVNFQIAKPIIQLSDSAEISLLTCTPGMELYSIFGHSAIRVFDPAQNLDKIYNYIKIGSRKLKTSKRD